MDLEDAHIDTKEWWKNLSETHLEKLTTEIPEN